MIPGLNGHRVHTINAWTNIRSVDAAKTAQTTLARLKADWMKGNIIIIGVMDRADKELKIAYPRQSFLNLIPEMVTYVNKYPEYLDYLKSALKWLMAKGPETFTTEETDKFAQVGVGLMCLKLCGLSDADSIDGSGLFSLMIIYDADDSLPWQERGLLGETHIRDDGGLVMELSND